MTEITRETLGLAALAAGHEIEWYDWPRDEFRHGYPTVGKNDTRFAPHLDDGDAFRLMVAIRGAIEVRKHDSWAAVADYDGDRPGALMEVEHDGTPSDAARAAREAIVLCAAAVGERMRGGR